MPAVCELLESGVAVDEANDHGVTALMLAASQGSEELVGILLERGADVTRRDAESGYTALHRALLHCHFTVAARLVQAGAGMDSPLDREGLSPLSLLRRLADEAPIAACERCGGTSTAGYLITWGAAGSVAIGRGAGASSHAVAAGRVELGDGIFASAVAASKLHTLIVDSDGGLYSCGLGVGGRLGHGDQKAAVVPRAVRLSGGVRVREVAAGLDHSLALTTCGELWTWGAQTAPLGYEATADQLLPRRVKFQADRSTRALCAATSDRHCLVCTHDSRGAVACYGWGANEQLQLGLRVPEAWIALPRRVESLSVLGSGRSLACGGGHSAGVGADGAVFSWGNDRATPKKAPTKPRRLFR